MSKDPSVQENIPPSTQVSTPARPSSNLRVLMLTAFVLALGWSTFNRFVSPLLRDSGVGILWIGLFYSVWSGVGAVAAPVGGILADTFGRRPVLIAGRSLSFLGWVVVMVWPSRTGLLLGAAIMGLGWVSGSAVKALIAESASEGRRASAFAATGSLDNFAAVLSPLAAGLLSDRLGLRPVLFLMLIPYFTGIIITTRVRETLARGPGRQQAASGEGESTALGARLQTVSSSAWSTGVRYITSPEGRGSLVMSAIWILTGFMMGLTTPLYGLHVLDRYGTGYAGVGSLGAAAALAATAGQVLGGRLADRFGYSRIMMVSLCCTAPLWLLMPPMPTAGLFTLTVALSNFLGWVAAPSWEALSAETATRSVRGATGGIHTGMLSIGNAIGGGALGLLYRPGTAVPFLVMAVNDVVMLVLVITGVRLGLRGFARQPRDLSEASTQISG